jgi:hypothetical protein
LAACCGTRGALKQAVRSSLQFVILLGGRTFFDFVEGDSRSSAIYLEQVEHRLRLFAPQVPRIGF